MRAIRIALKYLVFAPGVTVIAGPVIGMMYLGTWVIYGNVDLMPPIKKDIRQLWAWPTK